MLFKKLTIKILVLIICLISRQVLASTSKAITISGSSSIKAILNHYEPVIEKDSGILINVIAKNSKQGVMDLVNGDADLAIISTPLTYLSKDLPNIDVSSLRSYPLGKFSVALVVHPLNAVKKLTFEQVKDILQGKITNWQALGGDNEEIIIVTEFSGGGIRSIIEQTLLKGKINIPIKAMENAAQIKDIVAAVPNAFGLTSSSLVDSTVNIIELDKVISQPIIFVARPVADERITKFIKALKVVNLNEIY
ncbi:MAG: ABC-type phosphate transport system periplasmic component-like protein [Rickettsiaceae bacterium]|jgi:phosphate transport system substrate-binding protein|nr:ABC-type phosphate transport system periplasmic component-like protein [Rickettsiaceae bacterium]